MTSIKQIAALPYRIGRRGTVEVLLITSRGTGRWVVPKGNPIRGLRPHQAAAMEAFEEAGISGVAQSSPVGHYSYDKVRRDGTIRSARVQVFPLAAHARSDDWPEQHQRASRWFGLADAAAAVDEPELKAIILAFEPPAASPRRSGPGAVEWLRRLLPGRAVRHAA